MLYCDRMPAEALPTWAKNKNRHGDVIEVELKSLCVMRSKPNAFDCAKMEVVGTNKQGKEFRQLIPTVLGYEKSLSRACNSLNKLVEGKYVEADGFGTVPWDRKGKYGG
jgi:hypothetical protein